MKKRTIIVTGLAVTYPLGGVAWDYLQYLLGLVRLGHDAYYLEDTGCWCYDPDESTFVEDAAKNVGKLTGFLSALEPGLEKRFCVRDAGENYHGLDKDGLADVLRRADLFINISTSCRLREEYLQVPVKALIDSDPLYTQAGVPSYLDGTADEKTVSRIEDFKRHDVFFSFGENVGKPGCLVPPDIFGWRPTRQPMVLDCWPANRAPARDVFTTVLSWRPSKEQGPLVGGVQYGAKNLEFEKIIDLPRSTKAKLELALSGEAPRDALREAGWLLEDGPAISATPFAYRDYIADSYAEFSTAKNAYVASGSGWFSCRSTCYMALGRPVVVQDTGFSQNIPTGEGVIAFTNAEEALAGIEAVRADWQRHSRAARRIAEEHFDASAVLSRLVAEATE